MGRRHAENAAHSIPGARLAAVFDADRAAADTIAGELDAAGCATLEELLDREDVRVVVIASPSRFHAEQAVAALSRGKDVLLEKPMAHSLAECDRVIGAAAQGSARPPIGLPRPHHPADAQAQRLIPAGALPQPPLIRAGHLHA